MSVRIYCTLAMLMAVSFCVGLWAADETPKGAGRGNQQAQTLLDHADDLGLTAEQKTKLQEIAKGPLSVLTDEQKKKAREYMGKGAGAGGKAKKNAESETPKKPDEKKPDEPKADAPKADAPKADAPKPDAPKPDTK